MGSKYDKLTEHLRREFGKVGIEEGALTFHEISLMVDSLPAGAKKRGWWANIGQNDTTPLPHVNAWHNAGCFVFDASPQHCVEKITFYKGRTSHGDSFFDHTISPEATQDPLTLSWTWQRCGALRRGTLSSHPDATLDLQFPRPPSGGGMYCFRFEIDTQKYAYVGETDDLRRRLLAYRSAKGSTERHVETYLHAAFDQESVPILLVVTSAMASKGNGPGWEIDLANEHARVLLEHAAIAVEKHNGRSIINRPKKSGKRPK